MHTLQRQALQFPLRRFRLFCGQEPAVSFLDQSSGLLSVLSLGLWVLLFSMCHRN